MREWVQINDAVYKKGADQKCNLQQKVQVLNKIQIEKVVVSINIVDRRTALTSFRRTVVIGFMKCLLPFTLKWSIVTNFDLCQ